MEIDALYSVDDLKDIASFLREIETKDEAILIKNNRPAFRIIRIGSEADVRSRTPQIKRVDLWHAMKEVLLLRDGKTAHAKEIANEVNAKKLYCTRSGQPVSTVHIRSRAEHRPEMFECLKGNIIRLKTN